VRAVRFHEYGDFDVLAVEEVAAPVPGEGEVSLRVRAAGVNPIDWKIVHGFVSGGRPLAEPRGLGVDVAGTVEQVGAGVSGLAPGDEVLGSSSGGAYAEVALSRPASLVAKPPAVPWEVAGGLAVVVGTASATLELLALKAGETLVVAGASGGVGSVATQLAVARGVRVIGTAGESRQALLRALGAQPVQYGDGLAERLHELAPDGADAALDTSGHGQLKALVEVVGRTERVLSIASSAEAEQLGVTFHSGGGGELTIPALRGVLALIEAGSFSFPIAGVYPLSQVGEALRESEDGHPAGKLIVAPD
jgi:NADPH:quinone reductase-like Zn-dependent oxidoreductase